MRLNRMKYIRGLGSICCVLSLLLFIGFGLSAVVTPAAALQSGDMAVIGINVNKSPQEAAIVALADIPAGTIINITDKGWDSTTNSLFGEPVNEGTITWTVGTTISTGVLYKLAIAPGSPQGSVTITPANPGSTFTVTGWTQYVFNRGGDQIFIYQGAETSPAFIYGFSNQYATNPAIIPSAGQWQLNSFEPSVSNQSNLPGSLTNGTTALALPAVENNVHCENYYYGGTKSGTKAGLLEAIGEAGNWVCNSSTPYDLNPGGAIFSKPLAVAPSITITSPTSGEKLAAGGKYSITWNYGGNPGPVRIDLLKGGTKVSTITANTPVGSNETGSYSWTMPETEKQGSNYQVRIFSIAVSSCTATSANFTINPPVIGITSPTSGETLVAGGEYPISWTYTGNPGPVRIDLLKGGLKVSTIIADTAAGSNGTGSYSWTIHNTEIQGNNYQVRISSIAVSSCTATSANFTINPPAIGITSPTSGETLVAGGEYPISWTYTGNPGPVRIDLLKGGSKVSTIIADTAVGSNGTGSYSWAIHNTEKQGSNYQVKISSIAVSSCTAISANFTINPPSVGITFPTGGEMLMAGAKFTISWTYTGNPGPVRLDLLNGGSKVSTIVGSTAAGLNGEGSISWTIPKNEASGSDYQVGISSIAVSSCTATSANFTITGTGGKASAGPDQKVSGLARVKLSGSNSINSGKAKVSYHWTQLDGPPVTLVDPSAVETGFVAPEASFEGKSLRFELSVSGAKGTKSKDNCIVNVVQEEAPPIANAGPNQTVASYQIVELDGSRSSAGGNGALSYSWRQISGAAVSLSDPFTEQPTFVAPDAGTVGEALVFELTVTDMSGLRSRGSCIVNVMSDTLPPTAQAGTNQTVLPASRVVLDGSGSMDEGGSIVSYEWRQIAGPPVTLSDPAAIKPAFVAPAINSLKEENLVFELMVTNSEGLRGKARVVITEVNRNSGQGPKNAVN